MKKDNYDIPGYKFFIVVPKEEYKLGENISRRFKNICEELESEYHNYGHILIPFEEVDGLAIKDLDSIIHGEILLACYISIPTFEEKPHFHSMIMHHIFSATQNKGKIEEEQSIDEFIFETMKNEYNNLNKSDKRIYNCFLTRYGSEDFVKQNIRK